MNKILIDEATVKLALEALNTAESDYGSPAWELGQEAITALREALAEQPAPVAWMHQIDCDRDDRDDFMAYYKQTAGYCIPLYTSPPAQRTWAGLTNDEYEAICDKHSEMSDFDFLEDIEAKLRSKNI